MAINPKHTYLKLVHTEFTDEHQLTFSSANTQKQFFDSLQGLEVNDFSYQRKDSTIRFEIEFEDVEKYNYCFYYNTDDLDPKYYYAYITNLEYKNDSLVEITIATDVFQTWQFDFIYKKSFVERKHVTDDIAGNHTIAEPVATGEYIVNTTDYYNYQDDLVYVIQASEYAFNDTPPQGNTNAPATNFGGIYMSGYAFICETFSDFRDIIEFYNTEGKISAIYNCYIVPKIFVNMNNVLPNYHHYYAGQLSPMVYNYSTPKLDTLCGYSPKNKKLLTYPYCYLLLSNNNGSQTILHYEKFTEYLDTHTCDFYITGVPTPRWLN